ncbi:hypothetical protein ANCDUO_00445 [Ancylostoma duodenale]|uniref:Uncharacterized protein n=1 Tax=Ancylostoma duodenale TaxID=51022 RepID=A0A0C2HHU5_9BILA|nr:hypothetical protein ANCDUO_00445 [Ancylostoma duodenale]
MLERLPGKCSVVLAYLRMSGGSEAFFRILDSNTQSKKVQEKEQSTNESSRRGGQVFFASVMQELEVLNRLCKELGESIDPVTRARAEQNLAELVESPQCLRSCMLLLEQGDVCTT